MYFYFYWIFLFFSRNFLFRGGLVIVLNFLLYNYFVSFEGIGEVNNFFYAIIFKVINIVSNIDLNLIVIFIFLNYVGWYNLNMRLPYLPFIVIYIEIFFCKTIPINLTNLSQVNINLLNGLFLVHPIILIVLLTSLLLSLKMIFNFYKTTPTPTTNLAFKNRFLNLKCNVFLITSLLLLTTGGWWAQQELNWGGWWAWDFVELANLNIFIFSVFSKHLPKVKLAGVYTYILVGGIIIIYTILIVYIHTRYNLVPSVHAFLTNLSFLQYDYVVTTLLFIVCCLYAYNFKPIWGITNLYSKVGYRRPTLNIFCLYILIGNFIPITSLLHYMFIKSLGLGFIKFLQISFFILIFNYLLVMSEFNTSLIPLLIFNPILVFIKKLFFYPQKYWTTFRKLHTLLFVFTILICYTNQSVDLIFTNSFSLWDCKYPTIDIKFNNFFISTNNVDNIHMWSNNFIKLSSNHTLNNSFYGDDFNRFSVIFLDNYSVSNHLTYVFTNRSLTIYYYYYYVFIIYVLIYMLFSSNLFYKNVFLFDLNF